MLSLYLTNIVATKILLYLQLKKIKIRLLFIVYIIYMLSIN